MTLDFFAEFRQFDTNKKSAEFSSKIVAENSAKKAVHFHSLRIRIFGEMSEYGNIV